VYGSENRARKHAEQRENRLWRVGTRRSRAMDADAGNLLIDSIAPASFAPFELTARTTIAWNGVRIEWSLSRKEGP
jgi:hypothetical protein